MSKETAEISWKLAHGGKEIRRISREIACRGSIIDLYKDIVRLPDGITEEWDFVCHKKGGGAACVPVLPDGRIILIRQFRPSVDREYLELPAGAHEDGEDYIDTAVRELYEETGYKAGKVELLTVIDSAPAFLDESTYIYLATKLIKSGEQKLDEAEAINVEIYGRDKIKEMLLDGLIRDAKTAAGLMAYLMKYK